ncbi:MAG: hypothetical protein HZB26_08860 [Candidatus Hydrogenedentes bacterium]|nr:hypothetical protein [Candidatus Hydrogenedentota bacterium]
MKKASWLHVSGATCVLMVMCLSATLSYGAVTADPASATFTSPQQSATIKLTAAGAPIPAKDIRSWQFLASGHDYKHMLSVEKMDGALKIAPSKTLEVGSYDLNIETAQGSVIVQVLAPLSDVPDVVEKMAALTGQSEKKIEEKMGLATATSRSEIKIDLPPVYYEGQTLELTVPAKPGPGHACVWFMNGDSVAEGPERNSLTYTFKEPGEYVLIYIETAKENDKTVAVARAKAHTRVVPVPGVSTEVAVNTETEFTTPPGYQKYVWRIDGKEVSREPALKHTFKEAGVHTVECLASSPDKGPAQGFLRTRYNTTVSGK